MPELRVFLDSSDYSVLSGPDAAREPFVSILQQLRDCVCSDAVAFYFTGPQVAEMAPLDPSAGHSAIRRAEMLVELCGRRCAISPERLIAWELAGALDLPRPVESIWSTTGDWFPGGALDLIAVSPAERQQTVMEVLAEKGLNRAARRLAGRRLRKPAAQRQMNATLSANAHSDELVQQMQQKYPMTAEDARVLASYVAGNASPDEASTAFGSSLGDPSRLFRWMEHQPDAARGLMAWVRDPASKLTASILQLADRADSMRKLEVTFGITTEISTLTGDGWRPQAERSLLSMAQRFAKEFLNSGNQHLSVETLEAHCHGLVCAVRTLYEAWRAALLQSRRNPKDSDFPDMLHAMYAPYFDIFRADGFMAPLIAKHTAQHRTKVVGKLVQLPAAIEAALRAS